MQPFNKYDDVAESFDQLIGTTPAIYLKNLNTTAAKIVLKLESENPMASVKDRLGLFIYENEEKAGRFKPGETIVVEATSGNTGIALAHLGAIRGYKVIITIPESMSIERRCLMRVFGAELVLTSAELGMKGAIMMAQKIIASNPKAVLANQFHTKYNPMAHELTTGPEIWRQCKGNIHYFVCAVGTSGTLIGVSRYLKRMNSNIKCIAVEPAESPVLSGGEKGAHKIQGIGTGFIPAIFDWSVVDEVITVSSNDAIKMAKDLARREGVFCGFSSGANVCASLRLAKRPDMEGKTICTVIPSFGERYLSTALFKSISDEVQALPVVYDF